MKRKSIAVASITVLICVVLGNIVACSFNPTTEYALIITSTEGGSVTRPGEGTYNYDQGEVVTLVAKAEEGCRFGNWMGDVGTIANVNAATTTITTNGDYSITANFVAVLTISSTAGGSVTTPGEGTFTYDAGTVVDLVAEAEEGYRFVNWTGSASGTTSTITITMNSDKSLTAHFETISTAPEVLFSDNFSDEAGVWDTYSDEYGSVFYKDGWLHLINNNPAQFATGTWAHKHFTDFILEVETKLVAGTDNNWHTVMCRCQDSDNFYYFSTSADGYYSIYKFVNGSWIALVSLTYSSYINQGVGAVNLIHIECIGSYLSLSVNGHLLEEVTDATFTGGDIALAASALAGTFTEIAFDNIIVSKP